MDIARCNVFSLVISALDLPQWFAPCYKLLTSLDVVSLFFLIMSIILSFIAFCGLSGILVLLSLSVDSFSFLLLFCWFGQSFCYISDRFTWVYSLMMAYFTRTNFVFRTHIYIITVKSFKIQIQNFDSTPDIVYVLFLTKKDSLGHETFFPIIVEPLKMIANSL